MSLKAVELQIAIPKTFDAGKMQEQQQQNVINQQLHANEALKREVQRQNSVVNNTDGMDALSDEEQKKGENSSFSQQNNNENNQSDKAAKHPFKGNLFDFSG